MRGKARIDSGYNQMRWVVLLLAVAVILPTVGLLWFISQVVGNERFAVRQKLITVYKEQLEKTLRQTDTRLSEYYELLDNKEIQVHPYRSRFSAVGQNNFAGLLVYNTKGQRVYPLLSSEIGGAVESSEVFKDAWELEFVEHEFSQAAEIYERKAMDGDDHVRLAGLIGKSRCLAKLEKPDEAIAVCKEVAFSPLEKTAGPALLVLIGNARLLLLNLTQDNAAYSALFKQTFEQLASMLYSVNEAGFALPADHNLFLAQALVRIARKRTLLDDEKYFELSDFERLIAAEELSIRVSENFPEADTLENVKEDKLQHLLLAGETLYGIRHKTDGATVLALLSTENIASIFANFETDFRDSDVAYRIVDESGRFVAGADEVDDEPFVVATIGGDFPGWKIALLFRQGDVFEKAASQRITIYIWTGVLVIVLIFIAAGIAAQVVRKQIKLNKLKNDFIATVSHELKTPLASIRLLVDTLLEGNYKDQQQVTEYFQLVSKENERLTRLVDNFLTFSRMERNKQTFEMAETRPADIARAAAEAVKTKFNTGRCNFQVQIADNLPDIFADRDIMVTAIINLLDNAHKYSCDDKKIELKVFSENNLVCFSVKDNGIGMTHRQMKKIFDRFYQADTSLSRRAEGTGLGLSIVKFIVDAHKGTISVDSRPGEGSTFTVKLPAIG
ncbi:MAG: HAMP domain-containing histidine kinase [Sedimentisphaerales bacterium]|nr:HAMP domain-containing histidine kinase [Sedimentisphaerales bacterium]